MKLNVADLAALKLPFVVLVAVALAGGGLVYATTRMIANEKRQVDAQETRLKEARTRYQRSGDERDLIVRYLAPYQALQSRGLIGPEQRINWLDAMRAAHQQTRIFAADYQVSVQQPYAYARELNAQGLGLAQSLMKLNLQLAHEEDLVRFLSVLEGQRAGAFDVNQCTLERTAIRAPGVLPRAQANVRADCELAWITINPEAAVERRP